MTKGVRRMVRVGLIAGTFAAGYLCGTVGQAPPAEAQMGDMMKKAGESGGALGSAAKLGTTINEMQTHVSELQKGIDTLNQIKAGLGG